MLQLCYIETTDFRQTAVCFPYFHIPCLCSAHCRMTALHLLSCSSVFPCAPCCTMPLHGSCQALPRLKSIRKPFLCSFSCCPLFCTPQSSYRLPPSPYPLISCKRLPYSALQ